ncbi:MAG: hypothetical protein ACKO38_11755 [Planctomycetota bacterium]
MKPAIAAVMRDATLRLPLSELANGRAIPLNRYWQAATLTGFLIEAESLRAKLPELFRAARLAGDTDLGLHLRPVFGLEWPDLERQWREYVKRIVLRQYASAATRNVNERVESVIPQTRRQAS